MRALAAVSAEWQIHAGAEFDLIRAAYLRRTGRTAEAFPCLGSCGCSHRLHKRSSGFVGVCQCDDESGCGDILVTAEDAALWELDELRLGRSVCRAFGCEPRQTNLGPPSTWQIGSFGGTALPVVLTIQRGPDEFRGVVAELVAALPKHFVVVSPTGRFVNGNAQAILKAANAGVLDLERHVKFNAQGELCAVKPPAELFAPYLPGGERMAGAVSIQTEAGKILWCGKFGYRPGFVDVWLHDEPYNLRERTQARLCIQYLVENEAFSIDSARHFLTQIDPYVRTHSKSPHAAEPKIDHYFTDPTGNLPALRKALIQATGLRDGRFFLKVE